MEKSQQEKKKEGGGGINDIKNMYQDVCEDQYES